MTRFHQPHRPASEATLWIVLALLAIGAPTLAAPATSPGVVRAADTPSPQRVLGLIRATFKSHRPPPPYVTFTMIRKQTTSDGFADPTNSYTYEIWTRTSDRASLARKVFRFPDFGPPEFQRPAFNEARDPGPPTADLFEPAPLHPHSIDFVPTPEASQTPLPVIASVRVSNEFDYRVAQLAVEGNLIHLWLTPIRDPDRNRLRELWADRTTYELRKLVATDTLFIQDGPEYAVTFTVTLGTLEGRPVVTDIHGVVGGMILDNAPRHGATPAPAATRRLGDEYSGDGKTIDYKFENIKFPPSLPDWYFDPHTWAQHGSDYPQ
jgi:hypothetical protein